MSYEPSTIESESTPLVVSPLPGSQQGPHFDSKEKTATSSPTEVAITDRRESFDEIVEKCEFELDENLHPEALMSQKVMMLLAVLLPFIGVIIGAVVTWQTGFMGWPYLAMILVGWIVTSLGITIGFHRLMSHKAFETYRWVRALWMCIGAMSVEGAPLVWCAVHRRHHSCSDREGDPHSPHLHDGGYWNMVKGLCYAQIGWLFAGYWSEPNVQKYIPDLMKDKLLVKLSQWYGIFVLLSFVIPTAIGYMIEGFQGAMLGLLWGGFVRIFLAHHVTWSINSVCHVFGSRDYKSNDHSTNNPICGVLAMGEGWHNNHHAFPSSARHGLKWWQFDLSWLVISAMKKCGLAWNVKLPSHRALESKRVR